MVSKNAFNTYDMSFSENSEIQLDLNELNLDFSLLDSPSPQAEPNNRAPESFNYPTATGYGYSQNMQQHPNVGVEGCGCEICRIVVPRKPESSFSCPEPGCPIAFTNKCNLARHQREYGHGGVPKIEFSCSFCPRKFRRSGELRKHEDKHRADLGRVCT